MSNILNCTKCQTKGISYCECALTEPFKIKVSLDNIVRLSEENKQLKAEVAWLKSGLIDLESAESAVDDLMRDNDKLVAKVKVLRDALENVHNIVCDNRDDRQSVYDVYAVSLKALKGTE